MGTSCSPIGWKSAACASTRHVTGIAGSRRSTEIVAETDVSESIRSVTTSAATTGRECSNAVQTSQVRASTTPTVIKPTSKGRGIRGLG